MFNEDNDEDDDDDNDGDLLDDDDDDEDVDDRRPSLRFNSKYSTTTSNNKTTSNLMPTIDADTRIKLEALLANAGKTLVSLSLWLSHFLELSRKFLTIFLVFKRREIYFLFLLHKSFIS